MPNDINNLDPKDEGLQAIFGDRFHDLTAGKPSEARKNQPTTFTGEPAKTAGNHARETHRDTVDASWFPEKPSPDFIDKLKGCVLWTVGFGALSMLFWYWQQTGQMASSAAVPSMCVCTALAGFGIGKNAIGRVR